MSVASIVSKVVYITSGQKAPFPIPFYFLSQQDILVQTMDADRNVVTYMLNRDYTITGTTNAIGNYDAGATLNFNVETIPGMTLSISRVTNRTNTTIFLNHSILSSDVLNQAFDKIYLLLQEGFIDGFQGSALGAPTSSGVDYFVGDWFKNSNPVPGDVFGWICTTAGSPGVWSAFGLISLLS